MTNRGNLSAQAKAFADACYENSIPELTHALTAGVDPIDCAAWEITAAEWRDAIVTVLRERADNA